MIEKMATPVPCSTCGVETTIENAIYSERRDSVYGRERWSAPARLLAWALACGHHVDPDEWMLITLCVSDTEMAYWFAPADTEFPVTVAPDHAIRRVAAAS